MVRYRRWRERPEGEVRRFDVDAAAARRVIDGALDDGREQLTPDEALEVLRAYGIPTVESRVARTADEAVAAAREIGLPVVLKVISPDIVHKTDVGGIAVDIRTEEEVREAFARIDTNVRAAAPDARIEGMLVERFVAGGRETIVGMTVDPSFGPVLMFGLGGIYVEALGDVAFRVAPVTDVDARELVRSIRGRSLLEGVRGEPPVDLDALVEVVQRVSQLVGDEPRIAELDINPFLAFEDGGVAVDARIRVAAVAARRPALARI